MTLAGRVSCVGGVAVLALLVAGGLAIVRARDPRVTSELRLVASPEDFAERAWDPTQRGSAAGHLALGRPDVPRERSDELPAWFGRPAGALVRIAGRVRGATGVTTIRLAIDVPDPGIWTGRALVIGADGGFDFGPMRSGRYVLVASGPAVRSPVTPLDTTQGSGDRVDVLAVPCRRFAGEVDRPSSTERDTWVAAAGAAIELAGESIATTDAAGRFEVCAADEDDLVVRLAGYAAMRWVRTLDWHRRAQPLDVSLDEVSTGTVFEADGAPAPNVGVQPIWGSLLHGGECRESAVVVTSDRDGRFRYLGDRQICGLRILRATTMYEAPLTTRAFTMRVPPPPRPPPLPVENRPLWPASPVGPVLAVQPIGTVPGTFSDLIVRLVDPVREPATGFIAALARAQGERGTWLHGRVVHDGAPLSRAIVDVRPPGDPDDWATTRMITRRDGSFDIYLQPDGPAAVVVVAEDRGRSLQGRAEITLGPGPGASDTTIELTAKPAAARVDRE